MNLFSVKERVFTKVRHITDLEYQQYLVDSQFVQNFEKSLQPVSMVVENEKEFHSEMQEVFDDYCTHGVTTSSLNRYTFRANRRLLNYLTSTRFFLDFSASRIARRFGSQSKERIQFQEACGNAFDGVFAYRFMYKLRNFSQHCGFPLGGLNLISSLDEAADVSSHNFIVYFDSKKLLEDYDSWGKVKIDLQKSDRRLFVKPLLSDMTEELHKLNILALSFDYPEATAAGRRIMTVLQDALDLDGMPAIGDFIPGDLDERKFELKWPPLRMLEHLKLLNQRR